MGTYPWLPLTLGDTDSVGPGAHIARLAGAAIGAAGVHTPFRLAQKPPLIQLPALINIQATGVGAVQLEAQGALTDQALLGADAAAVNAAAFIGVLL